MTRHETPPKWVADLVERACTFLGETYRPTVLWCDPRIIPEWATPAWATGDQSDYRCAATRTSHAITDLSAGETDIPLIRIWYGKLRVDQRLAVLHELAHWSTGEGHTARFWDVAWRLYAKYMPRSIAWVLEREARYKTGALHGAIRAGIVDKATARTNPHLRRDVSFGQ